MNFYLNDDSRFSSDIPEQYRKYLLAGAAPSFAEFSEGSLLLQHIDGIGYYVRYDRSFTEGGLAMTFSMKAAGISLLYMLEGSIRLDGSQPLNEGSYYLCCIGIAPQHSVTFGKGTCRILQIDVADALYSHATEYLVLSELYTTMADPGFTTTISARQGNMDYRILLLTDMLLKSTGTSWEIELLVQSTASALIRLFVEHIESTASDASSLYGIRKLETVRQYIAANLALQVRMAQLAKIYGGSVAKLNKEHRRHYGESLQHYTHVLKMEHALALLRDKDVTVNEIADMTGYNNANNFTRAFTAYFGYTPSAARRHGGSQTLQENDRT